MQNSAYSSSSTSSLKRSISTPGTLFSLKSLSLESDSFDYERNKSHSSSKHGFVTSSFKLLNKIAPEELARQLTLIDWSIFSRINISELEPGQWTGARKHILSPNVVDFTRRFNIIIFWVSDEILAIKSAKQRADVISYFIKVCNHLIELKSLYSSYAIFCALTSEPIHRLEKSWAYVGKKDRVNFAKICDLFSQSDNSIKLRTLMENALNSPNFACIPNLSTFLRDIIHIDSYYPENDLNRSQERARKLDWIHSFILKCQQSNYDNIEIVEYVYDYLNSFSYIEELQKFREDDYYKISLKLEPSETPDVNKNKHKLYHGRFNSQYDISSHFYVNEYDTSLVDVKQARSMLNKSLNEDLFFKTKYLQEQPREPLTSTFIPGHRKTNSLEGGPQNGAIINKSNSLNKKNMKINLIDDSPSYDLYAENYLNKTDCRKPTLDMKMKKSMAVYNIDSSSFSNEDDASSIDDHNENGSIRSSKLTCTYNDLLHSGYIARKTILKLGKKPSITFWFNYQLGLSNDSLLFFSSKSNCQSKAFCAKPLKILPLTEWTVHMSDNTTYSDKTNIFTLADHACKTVYRIKTTTENEAREWVEMIHKIINNLKCLYML